MIFKTYNSFIWFALRHEKVQQKYRHKAVSISVVESALGLRCKNLKNFLSEMPDWKQYWHSLYFEK